MMKLKQRLLSSATSALAAFVVAFLGTAEFGVACVAQCQTFSAGSHSSCVLTNASENNVRCFGWADGGTNTVASLVPPQDIDLGGARAVQVILNTGYSSLCILTDNGGLRCGNGFGYGQPYPSPQYSEDIQFDFPNIDVVQVACGIHTCALLATGKVSCFGRNDYFQIGSKFVEETNSPPYVEQLYVAMPNNDKAKQICVGYRFSCVLSVHGDVACFGRNNNGQLGYGGNKNVSTPAAEGYVKLTNDPTLKAVKIACGYYHTAVILENGKLKTFGSDLGGKLGYPYDNEHGSPRSASYYSSMNGYSEEFVRFSANRDTVVKDVSCGGSLTCVITEQNELFCFGSNNYGQLGYGGNVDNIGGEGNMQPHVVGPAAPGVEAVECGSSHTCVRFMNSTMKCFGWGYAGALGTGSTADVFLSPSSPPVNLGAPVLDCSQIEICDWNSHFGNTNPASTAQSSDSTSTSTESPSSTGPTTSTSEPTSNNANEDINDSLLAAAFALGILLVVVLAVFTIAFVCFIRRLRSAAVVQIDSLSSAKVENESLLQQQSSSLKGTASKSSSSSSSANRQKKSYNSQGGSRGTHPRSPRANRDNRASADSRSQAAAMSTNLRVSPRKPSNEYGILKTRKPSGGSGGDNNAYELLNLKSRSAAETLTAPHNNSAAPIYDGVPGVNIVAPPGSYESMVLEENPWKSLEKEAEEATQFINHSNNNKYGGMPAAVEISVENDVDDDGYGHAPGGIGVYRM